MDSSMDAATATRSSTARGSEYPHQTTTTTTTPTTAISAVLHDAVSTVLRDAGNTLMALAPLVGALGNMDAVRLAMDCACMLGSFTKAAALETARGALVTATALKTARGALVQRVASPPAAASLGGVEAPFGLCLACHEPLQPPGDKHLEMMAQGLWGPRKRCTPCNVVIKARVAEWTTAGLRAAGERAPDNSLAPGPQSSSTASTPRLPPGLGAGPASGAAATISRGGRAGVAASATSTPATSGSTVRQGKGPAKGGVSRPLAAAPRADTIPGDRAWSAFAGAPGPAGVPGGVTPPVHSLPAASGAGPIAAAAAPAAAAPAASGLASGEAATAAVGTSAASGPVVAAEQDRAGEAILSTGGGTIVAAATSVAAAPAASGAAATAVAGTLGASGPAAVAGQDRAGEAFIRSAAKGQRRRHRGPAPSVSAYGVLPPSASPIATSAAAAAAAAAAEHQLIESAIRTTDKERALIESAPVVQFHRGDRVVLFGLGSSVLNGRTATLLDRAPPRKGSVPRWTVSLPGHDPLRLPIANMRLQDGDLGDAAAQVDLLVAVGTPVQATVARLARMTAASMPITAVVALETLVEAGLTKEATAAAGLWACRQHHGTFCVNLMRVISSIHRTLPNLGHDTLNEIVSATDPDADDIDIEAEGSALLHLAHSLVPDPDLAPADKETVSRISMGGGTFGGDDPDAAGDDDKETVSKISTGGGMFGGDGDDGPDATGDDDTDAGSTASTGGDMFGGGGPDAAGDDDTDAESEVNTGGEAWACGGCGSSSSDRVWLGLDTRIGCTFEGHHFCDACTCACAAFPLPREGSANALLQRHESREGRRVECCDQCHSLWNNSLSDDPCSSCNGHLTLPFLEKGRLYCCYCRGNASNDPSDQGGWEAEPAIQEGLIDGVMGAELAGAAGHLGQAENLGGGAGGDPYDQHEGGVGEAGGAGGDPYDQHEGGVGGAGGAPCDQHEGGVGEAGGAGGDPYDQPEGGVGGAGEDPYDQHVGGVGLVGHLGQTEALEDAWAAAD